MPTIHSKLGASAAERWLNCPGSIRLSEGQPDKTSRFAAEGTAAHAVGEWALANRKDPRGLLGYYVDGDERLFEDKQAAEDANEDNPDAHIFEVDDEMVAAVRVYYEYIIDLVEGLDDLGMDPAFFIEQGFDLSYILDGMFGTNDASVFVPGRELVVADYKHGAGKVVEVEDNPQLLYYALGALIELCYTEQGGVMTWDEKLLPSTVKIVIVQPRARHPSGPVREWTTTPEYIIDEFAEELRKGAEATRKKNAKFKAGEWCHFCSAKGICKEFQDEYATPISEAFDDDDFDDLTELGQEEKQKAAKAYGKKKGLAFAEEYPERLSDVLSTETMIKSFLETIRQAAISRALAGETISGFKVVRNPGRRRWIDEKKAAESLELVLDEDEIYDTKMKSPAALERLGYKEDIEGLWEKPDGKLTVAPEADSRDAVEIFSTDDLEED